jgi:hypothetical protein
MAWEIRVIFEDDKMQKTVIEAIVKLVQRCEVFQQINGQLAVSLDNSGGVYPEWCWMFKSYCDASQVL